MKKPKKPQRVKLRPMTPAIEVAILRICADPKSRADRSPQTFVNKFNVPYIDVCRVIDKWEQEQRAEEQAYSSVLMSNTYGLLDHKEDDTDG